MLQAISKGRLQRLSSDVFEQKYREQVWKRMGECRALSILGGAFCSLNLVEPWNCKHNLQRDVSMGPNHLQQTRRTIRGAHERVDCNQAGCMHGVLHKTLHAQSLQAGATTARS